MKKSSITVFLMLFILIVLSLVTESYAATGYPSLIYEKGLNVSLLKNITYSILEKDFKDVNMVYFHNSEYIVKSSDGWQSYSYIKGRYDANIRYFDYKGKFWAIVSEATIHIYAPQSFYPEVLHILRHELKHHRCYVKGRSLFGINDCNLGVDENGD